MKPAARIQATIEILERIKDNTRVPMDSATGDYMRHRRYIGSKDRAEIARRLYDIVRAHARLGWWLEKTSAQDTPRNRMILWLALGEPQTGDKTQAKRFKDLFDGSQYAPAALSPDEQTMLKPCAEGILEHTDMPEDVLVECPPEHKAALQDYFGPNFTDEMSAMLKPATLDLRVNIFTSTREKAAASLKDNGIETDPTPHSPWGLRCRSKAFLSKTKAFTKGWVEIQDEGSQLIATLCDPKPGLQIIDYCAGGGGKTLALAAAMKRKGRIVAMDNNARRLEKGKRRYKKAYLADIIEIRCSAEDKTRKWLKRQKEKFECVLTDVPCSGTGTWRRNPDMRWNTYGPSLEELVEIQADILDKAALLVKPGGRLVYATCSLLPVENEDQIDSFLKRNPTFKIRPVPTELGMPFMRLTPHRHRTDGFFGAILTKEEAKTEEQESQTP